MLSRHSWLTGLLGGLALLTTALAPALAQDASPPRPSHIHVGDCDELGEVIQPLNSLTVPSGEVLGNSDAVVAEAAFTTIEIPLSELVASDHALKVHLSADQIQTYLACGDIGGALDADGALIVGIPIFARYAVARPADLGQHPDGDPAPEPIDW